MLEITKGRTGMPADEHTDRYSYDSGFCTRQTTELVTSCDGIIPPNLLDVLQSLQDLIQVRSLADV